MTNFSFYTSFFTCYHKHKLLPQVETIKKKKKKERKEKINLPEPRAKGQGYNKIKKKRED